MSALRSVDALEAPVPHFEAKAGAVADPVDRTPRVVEREPVRGSERRADRPTVRNDKDGLSGMARREPQEAADDPVAERLVGLAVVPPVAVLEPALIAPRKALPRPRCA